MRPIDADALIEKCGGWYVDECTESGFIGTLENLLATEPTIQPQSTTGQLNDGARSTAQSTELIDRQAAIDAIANCTNCENEKTLREYATKHSLENGWTGGVLDALDAVKDLPPAQPEPHWIPVSERLPRDGSWNIFTDGKNISVERYKADAIDHFFPAGRWFELEDVIAWMPLPEAYKPNK